MDTEPWALLAAFVGSAAATWILTPIVAGLARRLGVLDFPGGRRVHTNPTPRLGGVALVVGLAVGALVYALSFGPDVLWGVLTTGGLLAFLLPALLVCLVGAIDDVRGLSPGPRIAAEAVAASFLIQGGYVIDVIANPFGPPLELGLFAFPITLAWFVGVTNAFNLIDGLDGLLGSVALTALLGIAAIALLGERAGSAIVALALAGALAGFLRWNWAPAKIFLGDSGSLLIGFTVAALSIKVARNPFGTLALHVPLLLCALPLAETTLTLARRYVSGHPYLTGDRSHIHHVLVNKGWSVPRASITLAGVSALFSLMAFLSRAWREEGVLVAFAVLSLVALGLLRWLGYVELKVFMDRLRQAVSRQRRPGLPLALGMARLGERIRQASDEEALAAALRDGVAAIPGARFVALELAPGVSAEPRVEVDNAHARAFAAKRAPGGGPLWLFSGTPATEPAASLASIRVTFPLPLMDGHLGTLVFEHGFPAFADGLRDGDLRRYLAEPLGEKLLEQMVRRSVVHAVHEEQ